MFPHEFSSYGALFAFPRILGPLAAALAVALVCLFAADRHFLVLQQSGYRARAFLRFAVTGKTRKKDRLRLAATLSLLGFFALSGLLTFVRHDAASYVGFLAFFGFFGWFLFLRKKERAKSPLRNTPRMIRIKIAFFVLTFALAFGLAAAGEAAAYAAGAGFFERVRLIGVVLTPYFVPFLVLAAKFVLAPVDAAISRSCLKKCRARLAASSAVRVGIAGSYGKTTVKNALNAILSEKYRTGATPASFNTPLGICRAAEAGAADGEVFLAEMGARRRGDIAELCALVRPTVGVVTAIGKQHLESFGSEENVLLAKGELPSAVPEDGFVIFGRDEGCGKLYAARKGNKALAPEIVSVSARTGGRTRFTLRLASGDLECETALLGRLALEDVALAAGVAEYLGLEPWQIAAGIAKIAPVPHRMETIDCGNGTTVIDDSYNSNPVGAAAALEALKEFSGKKIVVTPGFVELGKAEKEENARLGTLLAAAADRVYLVGLLRTRPIKDALLAAGFSAENAFSVSSLEEATEKIEKSRKKEKEESGDGERGQEVVLFLNDLPDAYDE